MDPYGDVRSIPSYAEIGGRPHVYDTGAVRESDIETVFLDEILDAIFKKSLITDLVACTRVNRQWSTYASIYVEARLKRAIDPLVARLEKNKIIQYKPTTMVNRCAVFIGRGTPLIIDYAGTVIATARSFAIANAKSLPKMDDLHLLGLVEWSLVMHLRHLDENMIEIFNCIGVIANEFVISNVLNPGFVTNTPRSVPEFILTPIEVADYKKNYTASPRDIKAMIEKMSHDKNVLEIYWKKSKSNPCFSLL